MARNDDRNARKDPPSDERSTGLEGAKERGSGILRDADVEGADELSIGGGPPGAPKKDTGAADAAPVLALDA